MKRSHGLRMIQNTLIGIGSILEILPPRTKTRADRPRRGGFARTIREAFRKDAAALARDKAAAAFDFRTGMRQAITEGK